MVWQSLGPQPALAPTQHLGVLKVTTLGEDWHTVPAHLALAHASCREQFLPTSSQPDTSLQLASTAQPRAAGWWPGLLSGPEHEDRDPSADFGGGGRGQQDV